MLPATSPYFGFTAPTFLTCTRPTRTRVFVPTVDCARTQTRLFVLASQFGFDSSVDGSQVVTPSVGPAPSGSTSSQTFTCHVALLYAPSV